MLLLCLTIRIKSFFEYTDENNKKIDIENLEVDEQKIAKEYINEDDIVLELGARYGTVSCEINKKLKNKKGHVAVEPDITVLDSLKKNKDNNNCEFHILNGIISNKKLKLKINDYSTTTSQDEGDDIPNYTLEEVNNMYNLNFNVLVVDCEGCLQDFYKENPDFFKNLRMITYEKDMPDKCNYSIIESALIDFGYNRVREGFHEVWIKNNWDGGL
jgi:FkbM family methyltransferase